MLEPFDALAPSAISCSRFSRRFHVASRIAHCRDTISRRFKMLLDLLLMSERTTPSVGGDFCAVVLLRAKRDVAAAKVFFRRAFKSQGRLPRAITLDGYQASHRAAREFLGEHRRGKRTKIRSSKYLNNLIEQDHRSIKLRLGPMLGLKRFRSASTTIASIELIHRIRKGPFNLDELRNKDNRAPVVWNAVLAA